MLEMKGPTMDTQIIHQRAQARASRPTNTQWPRAAVLWIMTALISLGTNGCGSQPEFDFEKFELVSAQEGFTEFSLGKYTVPIPTVELQPNRPPIQRNRLEFDFRLFAVVPLDEQSKIEDDWKRHEGKIRDQVIRVCRHASVDDLLEPELTTLKARLSSALRPQLGDYQLRQLLITEAVSQEI
jgi:hypothetical protein